MKAIIIALMLTIGVGSVWAQKVISTTPASATGNDAGATGDKEAAKKEDEFAKKGIKYVLLTAEYSFPDKLYLLMDKTGTTRPVRITGGQPTVRLPVPSVGFVVFYNVEKPVIVATKDTPKTEPIVPPVAIPADLPPKVLGLISFAASNKLKIDFLDEGKLPIGTCTLVNTTNKAYKIRLNLPLPKGEKEIIDFSPGVRYLFAKELIKDPLTATYGCKLLHQVTPKGATAPLWMQERKMMITTHDDRRVMKIFYPAPDGAGVLVTDLKFFD